MVAESAFRDPIKFTQVFGSLAVNQTWRTSQGMEERALTSLARGFDFISVINQGRNIMEIIVQYVKQFLSEEEGVTAIEYGLIAALIAVVIIGAVQLVGGNLLTTFNSIATAL